MCREAIPLACRFRQREVLPEGTRIAQVIYLQLLRNCYELIYTSCLSGFPISSLESLAGLRFAPVGAKRSSTGRAAPRYGYVFFLDLQRSLQVGMNAHLSKPVEPEHLYQTLEELIWEYENESWQNRVYG